MGENPDQVVRNVERHEDRGTADTPAGSQTQEIKAEIVETRVELSETIDAIQERLSPRNLMDQAKDAVKEATVGKVQKMANTAGETASDLAAQTRDTAEHFAERVRDNPLPAALIGLGLGWVLYRATSGSSRRRYNTLYEQGRYRDTTGESGGDRWDDEREVVNESRVGDYGQASRKRVGEVVHRAGEVADRARLQVTRSARRAQSQFDRMLIENPLALGVAAFAVGAAVGLSIPPSGVENEWMGEARDSVVEKAQDLASQAKDKAQDLAQQALGQESRGPSAQP